MDFYCLPTYVLKWKDFLQVLKFYTEDSEGSKKLIILLYTIFSESLNEASNNLVKFYFAICSSSFS